MRIVAFFGALVAAAVLIWIVGGRLFAKADVALPPKVAVVKHDFSSHDENESASRFLAAVSKLDDQELQAQREAEVEYLRQEIASPAAASAPPPESLSRFLLANGALLRALRAQLASNPPPRWLLRADDLLDAPRPDVIKLNRLALTLASSALAEHSAHNDAAAWSDLGATWVLSQSLWERPEVESVLAALTGARLIAAVASKLPPPAPTWWKGYVGFDPRPSLAKSMDYQAWEERMRAEKHPMGELDDHEIDDTLKRTAEPFVRPLVALQADARVRDLREIASGLTTADPCKPLPQAARAQWSGTLNRFNRFLIEREGVAKLIALQDEKAKTGAWPAQIEDRSLCAQQRWTYKRETEGIRLAFNGQMPVPETRVITPLEFRR